MAPRLSKNIVGRDCIGTRISNNNDFTHYSLAAAIAMTRYSTSVEDRATICCFVELQEMILAIRNMRKAPVEVQSSRLPA